jgi:antitoxin MazE
MIVSVVAIGNSKGIRLPKAILEQLQINDQVELEVENKQIVLKPVKKHPRTGWEESFKEMSKNQEDTLLIPESEVSKEFAWEW